MKFFKAIRFDASDDNVYPKGAKPDEWVVSGCFEFATMEPQDLTGKVKQAFTNGLMGLTTYGRTTFVTVTEMSEEEYEQAVQLLVDYFVTEFGAPSREEAEPHAREEIGYIAELCSEKPVNTLFAVRRSLDEEGNLHEAFHEIKRGDPETTDHAKIWEIVPDDA
ncbi:MAG: hypothetical protein HKN05_21455 [Rhizobiales bacterium]|nr:hypothetical protein [Hyphomicrobiales bacterium]